MKLHPDSENQGDNCTEWLGLVFPLTRHTSSPTGMFWSPAGSPSSTKRKKKTGKALLNERTRWLLDKKKKSYMMICFIISPQKKHIFIRKIGVLQPWFCGDLLDSIRMMTCRDFAIPDKQNIPRAAAETPTLTGLAFFVFILSYR